MGKFRDWLFGKPAEEPVAEDYAPAAQEDHGLYVGPPIGAKQAASIQATLAQDEGYDAGLEYYGDDDVVDGDFAGAEEPDELTSDELVPGWKRKGRPYVHFRTVKIVDRDGGYKFKIRGRSGKPRHKSELYTEKSNAKRAAVAWIKKQAIPTKFVDDQYNGQVVYDTNEQDA